MVFWQCDETHCACALSALKNSYLPHAYEQLYVLVCGSARLLLSRHQNLLARLDTAHCQGLAASQMDTQERHAHTGQDGGQQCAHVETQKWVWVQEIVLDAGMSAWAQRILQLSAEAA